MTYPFSASSTSPAEIELMMPRTVSSAPPSCAERSRDLALQRLFLRIGQASSLPHIALRIIRLVADDHCDFVSLQRSIQEDPSLAARVLRRINSPAYGLRKPVGDLNSAIGLLGFRELRNIALTVYLSRFFAQPGKVGSYTREGLWQHLVSVASTSRLVSIVCGRAVPADVYVSGLLHDLGLILIDQHLRKHFCRVVQRVDAHTPTIAAEREVLGFDHAQLGGFVARQWNLPAPIVAAIQYHHTPQEYRGPLSNGVNIVAVANFLCSRRGDSSLGVHNVPPPPDDVYAGLDLDETDLRIIWEELNSTNSTHEQAWASG